eukprot:g4018.t1
MNEGLLSRLHAALFAAKTTAKTKGGNSSSSSSSKGAGTSPRSDDRRRAKTKVLMVDKVAEVGAENQEQEPDAGTTSRGGGNSLSPSLVWYGQRGPSGEQIRHYRRSSDFVSRCGPPVAVLSHWDVSLAPPPLAFPGVYVYVDTEWTLEPTRAELHGWPLLYLGSRRDDNPHPQFASIHMPYLVQHFAERTCARGIPCRPRDLLRLPRPIVVAAAMRATSASASANPATAAVAAAEEEKEEEEEEEDHPREEDAVARRIAEWRRRPYLAAYLSHQCYPHREQFFDLLASFAEAHPQHGAVHALGRCHGSNSSRASLRPSTRFDYLRSGGSGGGRSSSGDGGRGNSSTPQGRQQQEEDPPQQLHYLDEAVLLYSQYKFVIAFENHRVDGYVTEKIVNGFLAGAVPLYWGDDAFARSVFRPETFIAVSGDDGGDGGGGGGSAIEEDGVEQAARRAKLYDTALDQIRLLLSNDNGDDGNDGSDDDDEGEEEVEEEGSKARLRVLSQPPLTSKSMRSVFGFLEEDEVYGGSGGGGSGGGGGVDGKKEEETAALRPPVLFHRRAPRSLGLHRRLTTFTSKSKRRTAVVGGLAGSVTGLLGWGSAQVVTPGLTQWVGVTPLQAGGASLMTLAGITTFGAARFSMDGAADWSVAAALGLPALAASPLGVRAARRVAGRTLQLSFNTMTVALTTPQVAIFAHKYFYPPPKEDERSAATTATDKPVTEKEGGQGKTEPVQAFFDSQHYARLVQHAAFGSVIGFIGGFNGVAGLPWMISYLTLAETSLPHHTVMGTTFAACTPMVLLGLALLAFLGLGGYLFFTRKRKGRGEDSLNVAVWSADNLRKALNVISGGQTTITDESIRVLQAKPCTMPITVVIPLADALGRYCESAATRSAVAGGNKVNVSQECGLYTAGIIDYLLSELLELSSYKARDRSSDSKELKITPEDVTKAVEFDEELRLVFGEAGAEKTSAEEKG